MGILFTICIYGHKCVNFTNLKSILSTPHLSGYWPDGQRWTWKSRMYSPGKKNSNADTLSRYPIDVPAKQDATTELSGVLATLDSNEKVGQGEHLT